MFNILDYLNINNTIKSSTEKFSSQKYSGQLKAGYHMMPDGKLMKDSDHKAPQYGGGEEKSLSKGVMIVSILLNLIISFLFILFSLDYINVIDPKLTITNKSIYIILVYLLLISNGFMFLVNLINMIQIFA